ncbi:MAG: tetratricopeptide repeat protein [Fidelibacterota bacterium]
MKKLYLILILCSIGVADIPSDLFSQANDAMIYEKYEDAIQVYESILDLGYDNAELYYNLGNAYYRLHYLGQAIWAYSNVLKISPRDQDTQHNLAVAGARRIDRIDLPKPFVLLQTYRDIKSNFTLKEWIMIGSLILLFQALWGFSLQFGWIQGAVSQSILTGLIFLTVGIHGIALDKYFQEKRTNSGIVIANGVDAYSGPFYGENTILFRINEGSRADLHQSQKDWVEIILIDGKKGWIPAESIRALK